MQRLTAKYVLDNHEDAIKPQYRDFVMELDSLGLDGLARAIRSARYRYKKNTNRPWITASDYVAQYIDKVIMKNKYNKEILNK